MSSKLTKGLLIAAGVLVIVGLGVFALVKNGKIGATSMSGSKGVASLGNAGWYSGEPVTRGGNGTQYGYVNDIKDGFPTDVNIARISMGLKHALAIDYSNHIYAWGTADKSETLNGKPINTIVKPYQVSTSTFSQIAAGYYHSLAIDTNYNKVYSWGYNGNGELGNGNYNNSGKLIEVKGLPKPKLIIAGAGTSFAITTDGVYAWGDNHLGQLGIGSKITNSSVPVKVKLPTNKIFDTIDSDSNYQIALSNDKQVYTWDSQHTTPTLVTGFSRPIYEVQAGNGYYLASDYDGQLWIWGVTTVFSNTSGAKEEKSPIKFPGAPAIVNMDAGGQNIIVYTKDRQFLIAGRNRAGEAGPYQLWTTDMSDYNKITSFIQIYETKDKCQGGCLAQSRYNQLKNIKDYSVGPLGSIFIRN